jgi:hypothetical protein
MSAENVQNLAVKVWRPTGHSLKNIELSHGFDTENTSPEIYYQPRMIDELKNKTIFDPTVFTACGDYNKTILTKVLFDNFNKNEVILVRNKNISYAQRECYSFDGVEEVLVNSIFEYCDVIYSCANFISLMSGGHTLCQAIRKKNNFCITSKMMFNMHYQKGIFLNDRSVSYISF